MAEPSHKEPYLARLLEDLFGRTTAIRSDRCIPLPTGCGGPAAEFKDEVSKKEYAISGLCQECQDLVFKEM